jgi:hypothetical protein
MRKHYAFWLTSASRCVDEQSKIDSAGFGSSPPLNALFLWVVVLAEEQFALVSRKNEPSIAIAASAVACMPAFSGTTTAPNSHNLSIAATDAKLFRTLTKTRSPGKTSDRDGGRVSNAQDIDASAREPSITEPVHFPDRMSGAISERVMKRIG